ncbi:hypothetical protein [Pseudohalioglobus lutimaris]|jgi:hypothetical protein|uniref:Uncharacterized protein n=1 Tax=Pseudohalioglobus lutimaris TaxID=1737061 RepID=A0A2N5WX35_9GAMM|nr:hypothetical protein [Pseudohalioglobus lutimaris]PLW66788.1 hypothetical protein C0039_20015 [Pseudohalioglobus lutimaris]
MALTNIEDLIECDGQITLGYLAPAGCVAIANNEAQTLAMLRRRPGEPLMVLLKRLDHAIERAVEYEEYIDEINQS